MRPNGNLLLARLLLKRVAGVSSSAPSNIVGGPGEPTRDCAQFLQPSSSVRLVNNNQRCQSSTEKAGALEFVGFAEPAVGFLVGNLNVSDIVQPSGINHSETNCRECRVVRGGEAPGVSLTLDAWAMHLPSTIGIFEAKRLQMITESDQSPPSRVHSAFKPKPEISFLL
jgi:hypothetical protein